MGIVFLRLAAVVALRGGERGLGVLGARLVSPSASKKVGGAGLGGLGPSAGVRPHRRRRRPRRGAWAKRGRCANQRSQAPDVSQRNGGVGAWRRREAGKMRSMIRMGPPQSGQTWLASTASLSTGSGDEEAFSGLASSSPSRARHKAIFLAR